MAESSVDETVVLTGDEIPLRQLAGVPFIASIFLGAILLFLLEPMVGRVLLPTYGGAPAVWNTCLVCFQSLLMLGYAWAHWSVETLGVRRQGILHASLLVSSLLLIPYALPVIGTRAASPVISISSALLATIGLPFVLLSANSSLVQRWYSISRRGDPFWLYALSNAGSLLALIGYPLLFEPLLGLARGWRVWSALYVFFVAGSLGCLALLFHARTPPHDSASARPEGKRPGSRLRAGWTFRAAVASSLLLSVTMKITTDVASAPIFWVIPLSLYLLTFILAFSPRFRLPRWIVATGTATGIAWSLAACFYTFPFPLWLDLTMLLATVFFGCLLCHGDLADSRPAPQFLTGFYLWISLGGAVGGILNSLVAPLVFESVAEYPITLLLLVFVIHAPGGYLARFPRERMRRLSTWLPPITTAVALIVTGLMMVHRQRSGEDLAFFGTSLWYVMPLGVIAFGLLLARHAGQFEFVVLCMTIYFFSGAQTLERAIVQERSFFGVLRVFDSPQERYMTHGTTIHGAQWKSGPLSRIPIRYYHPAGPFGVTLPDRPGGARMGVVGLGVGSLAAAGEAGQEVIFFEIDPEVERIARNYFTYLRDAKSRTDVRIGDGRLLLKEVPDEWFDVLILDAFTSDSIPVHLLTREALALDLRKVRTGGVVLVHISNRHLDLSRVFRGWSRLERRPVAISIFEPTAEERAEGATAALAAAIAPEPRSLANLVATGKWQWLGAGPAVVWTDDRVDLLATLAN